MRIKMKSSTLGVLMIIIGCIFAFGGVLVLSESIGMSLGFFALGAVCIWLGIKVKRKK